MKQVIAIPLEEGRLCQHFGHCQQFAIIEAEEGTIVNEYLVTPPPHEPGLLPAWLSERGVTEVIAAGKVQQYQLEVMRELNIFTPEFINSINEGEIVISQIFRNFILAEKIWKGSRLERSLFCCDGTRRSSHHPKRD
jgi:hypothetical protein